MNTFRRISMSLALPAVLLGVLLGWGVNASDAYVLPSEQLLQFMAAHFSKFDTLVVRHSIERETWEGMATHEEILSMKSPDLLHAEIKDSSEDQGRVVDRSYRMLFMTRGPGRASDLLRGAGVRTDKVSFTRVDGAVAYLIGDRSPESPKLAVEKARFLPLLFVYRSRLAGSPDLINVTFRDYRQVEQGWYPFDILYSSGFGWTERYKIVSIKANIPVQSSLFQKPKPLPAERTAKDEEIHSIIKKFDNKYGR